MTDRQAALWKIRRRVALIRLALTGLVYAEEHERERLATDLPLIVAEVDTLEGDLVALLVTDGVGV